MSNPPDRIYVRGDVPRIDMFRALRGWVEQHAAKEGKTLDPAWWRERSEKSVPPAGIIESVFRS